MEVGKDFATILCVFFFFLKMSIVNFMDRGTVLSLERNVTIKNKNGYTSAD